ncbi:hypothetical protein GGI21_001263, partial [Coemansia aciculifera]
MSKPIALAQRLPNDVLHAILPYVACRLDKTGNGYEDNIDELKSLLYVSSVWRAATLEYMWRDLNLVVSSKEKRVYVERPDFAFRFKLPANAPDLIRSITISVSLAEITDGTAYKLLSVF